MSHRIEQIESTLKRGISELLMRDLADPRIRGMVSVLQVKVTQDMHLATVRVSVIPTEYEKLTIHGLNSASKYIHGKLFKRLSFRRLPHLTFEIDPTIKKQAEIFAAIEEGLAKEKASEDAPVDSQEDTQETT